MPNVKASRKPLPGTPQYSLWTIPPEARATQMPEGGLVRVDRAPAGDAPGKPTRRDQEQIRAFQTPVTEEALNKRIA